VTQLQRLAKPFPPSYVQEKDGESYVAHGHVIERLLYILGPVCFDVVEVIRGDVAAVAPNPQGRSARAKAGTPALSGVVVGVLARLTATIDGRTVTVTEVGDCDDPHNWRHDGERAKAAASDAVKRAAARLGCGLELWVGESYRLDRWLAASAGNGASDGRQEGGGRP
jgi:hypothetical protein